MIVFMAGIIGYFGGNVVSIKDIMTTEKFGIISYCVGLFMSKQ